MILDPEYSLCVVEINEAGDSYRIVWGLVNGGRPTSEFPTHFMNHSVRVAATNGATRVIYHAHTPNVIAMTYVVPLTDRDFSRALWKSATECPVVFPGGVGVVPWMVPGGAEIAMATCEKMKDFEAAVWAQHGLFVSGPAIECSLAVVETAGVIVQDIVESLDTGHLLCRVLHAFLLHLVECFLCFTQFGCALDDLTESNREGNSGSSNGNIRVL